MAVQISLCLLSVLATILFLVVRIKKGGALAVITKAFASLCFVAYALFSLTQITWFNEGSTFILLGLVCGLIGDVLLDLKVFYNQDSNIYLNAGMLSFGVGHISYFVGMILIGNGVINFLLPILISVLVSLALTPLVILISKKIGLDFGKFLWQTIAYSFVLIFMSMFSIYLACLQLEFIILAGGFALFLLSDLVLSMQYFGGKQTDTFFVIVNHSLYYAAQILIATFLYLF